LSIKYIKFDKPSYHPGDIITATVDYIGALVTATFTASGGVIGTVSGTFAVLPSWTESDTGNRTWTLKSDNGSQAVFTAIA
jgi:hypothetical protein